MRLSCSPIACTLIAFAPLATASAQSPDAAKERQGVVTGVISDRSGAKIVHATIHLQGNGQQADAVTDAQGSFSVAVPPGIYQFSVLALGFEPYVREGFAVGSKVGRPVLLTLQVASENEVLTVTASGDATAADQNGSALVFKKSQLDTLSNNDATLQQQLLAIAGGDGQHPPQVFVDGFSGGRFPPKSSIREVRINQNPYSAQYDGLGFGRIEIFTKPGSDKLHGFFQSQGNDRSLNSRNPFAGAQPPYHTLFLDGNVSGPIGKATSFFLAGTYNDQENNAVVNAIVLDANFASATLSQAIPDPQVTSTYAARLDRQMSTNNTFTSRYEYNRNTSTNSGVGLLTLASEAYNSTITTQTLQLGNTQIIGTHRINETRFQYIRTRLQQVATNTAPTIIVQGSFNGGGSAIQQNRDNQDRFEFQDYFSIEHGKHFLRLGGRYRLLRDANLSTGNYNGQYTFPDLATYRITQQGIANGLSAQQIRAMGGGATQFNLTAGQPSATVLTGDLGVYADDEWKVAKAVTVNLGFRFETQSGVPDHSDPAPRVGVAWAVHQGDKHPAWFTLRGGSGLFYDRFDASNLLRANRQNGVTQATYFLQNPDTFPSVPSTASLTSVQPTIYRVSPALRSQYDIVSGASIERAFGKYGNIAGTYLNFRTVHGYDSLNINAPLPGTYNIGQPNSGIRPMGGMQNLYQFSSNGTQKGNILFTNINLNPTKYIQIFGFYVHQQFNSDESGAANFPSNSYNLAQDYGRATFTIPHRLFFGGNVQLPFGVSVNPFLIATGGRPFNITTGADNNGDSIYNDRPAFATDLSRTSVIRTRLGNFDTNPLATQTIIPINYGTGPAFVSLQLSAQKSFKFGPRPAPAASDAASSPAESTKPAGSEATKGPAPKPDPPYELGFSAEAQNLFNHVNGDTPVGVLTSPFFGQSISLNGNFFNNSAANRTVNLRAYFRF